MLLYCKSKKEKQNVCLLNVIYWDTFQLISCKMHASYLMHIETYLIKNGAHWVYDEIYSAYNDT